MQGIKDSMKKKTQARTPFLFKMRVHSYYSCGIRSEDRFCLLNELRETALCRQKQSFKKTVNEYSTTQQKRSPRSESTKIRAESMYPK